MTAPELFAGAIGKERDRDRSVEVEITSAGTEGNPARLPIMTPSAPGAYETAPIDRDRSFIDGAAQSGYGPSVRRPLLEPMSK